MMKCRVPGAAGCAACAPAFLNGWRDANERCNVGLLIRCRTDAGWRHAQIDVGKTFRQSVLRWYKLFDVPSLDAVLLTHDHADACFGLDEIRGLQPHTTTAEKPTQGWADGATAMLCLCDARTLKSMKRVFPYLFPPADVLKPGAFAEVPGPEAPAGVTADPKPIQRYVSKIDWVAFPADTAPFSPFAGLEVRALPVMHGEDYVCYGFGFGPPGSRVAYISDYTRLLPATLDLLSAWQREPGGIAVLVLDALNQSAFCPVHATVEQSLDVARKFRATRTLLVGMGHSLEHHETNAKLRRLLDTEGLDVQLARDGLFLELDL
ncbi:beta-lactamase-like protein [Pelagophyceae sp. CCMP2097]|nr:beta-lactamase-like protein [Pelagophyceae sp. CCMP2097]